MKTARQITLTILIFTSGFCSLKGQSVTKISSSSVFANGIIRSQLKSRIELRQIRKESHSSSFHLFSNKTFTPKLSVDLLDGKGIHLFTISNMNPIPAMNIGARINASLIITI